MAKGKGKKGGAAKPKKEVDPNALTEVDKAFYELQLNDLNKKLSRLRTLNEELELKTEQLTEEKEKLDEDRNDIIVYLKKILQEKTDEITELEERIIAMNETRVKETKKYEAKIAQMTTDYKQMHEQLTSENKLLDGKLNSLEEFRCQRDELMRRYEAQEQNMEAQEKRHKRELYEIERKFIISKDHLKKDMEAKLLQLSTEFHDATELRIAATTHRVIRENIAVNNELDVLLNNQQRLYNENTNLKNRDSNLRHQNELLEKENKIALAKVRVQIKLIERLTDDHKFMVNQLNRYKTYEAEVMSTRKGVKQLEQKITNLEHTKRILEQNLHHVRCDRTSIQTDYLYLQEENNRLLEIMLEAVSCIKEALTVRHESEVSAKVSKRENLLNSLLNILNKAKDQKIRCPSLDTVSLFEATYAKGDLGFVPKPVELRSPAPITRCMDTQTASSFEEYLATGAAAKHKFHYDEWGKEIGPDGKAVEEEYEQEEEGRSILFFDEQETVEEESDEGVIELAEEGAKPEAKPEAEAPKEEEVEVKEKEEEQEKAEAVEGEEVEEVKEGEETEEIEQKSETEDEGLEKIIEEPEPEEPAATEDAPPVETPEPPPE